MLHATCAYICPPDQTCQIPDPWPPAPVPAGIEPRTTRTTTKGK